MSTDILQLAGHQSSMDRKSWCQTTIPVVSPDQMDGLLKEIRENDAYGNGEIDFEEFVTFMSR